MTRPGRFDGLVSKEEPTITSVSGRQFACFPAALLVFVVNDRRELLLLSDPDGGDGWQVVNGAMEAGETVLAGVLRELREEAGESVRVRPLGTVHTYTFALDPKVRLVSICYLVHYLGGEVVPGDDMAGSVAGWFERDQIGTAEFRLAVPADKWVVARALELFDLWIGREIPRLENIVSAEPPVADGGG